MAAKVKINLAPKKPGDQWREKRDTPESNGGNGEKTERETERRHSIKVSGPRGLPPDGMKIAALGPVGGSVSLRFAAFDGQPHSASLRSMALSSPLLLCLSKTDH